MRRGALQRRAAQQRAADGHVQRRRNTFARDVADGEPHQPVADREEIVEVAPDRARGQHFRIDLVARILRKFTRQNALLDAAGDAQLAVQREQLFLMAERLADGVELGARLGQGLLEILEIDGLGQKIKGAAVHGGSDILHIVVGRDDDGAQQPVEFADARQQREPIHHGHVDVAEDDFEGGIGAQLVERVLAVRGKHEFQIAFADTVTKLLQDQRFQVGLVIDKKNFQRHGVNWLNWNAAGASR